MSNLEYKSPAEYETFKDSLNRETLEDEPMTSRATDELLNNELLQNAWLNPFDFSAIQFTSLQRRISGVFNFLIVLVIILLGLCCIQYSGNENYPANFSVYILFSLTIDFIFFIVIGCILFLCRCVLGDFAMHHATVAFSILLKSLSKFSDIAIFGLTIYYLAKFYQSMIKIPAVFTFCVLQLFLNLPSVFSVMIALYKILRYGYTHWRQKNAAYFFSHPNDELIIPLNKAMVAEPDSSNDTDVAANQ